MDNQPAFATPARIAHHMWQQDAFSQWLGIEILEIAAGYCRVTMQVRTDMCNGLQIAHGGISYSLADSALAFAANAQGKKAVSIETSISHLQPIHIHDILIATAAEKHLSAKIGVYEVSIRTEGEVVVALFKGTVYRTAEDWKL